MGLSLIRNLLLGLLVTTSTAFAQSSQNIDVDEITLEDLLGIKTAIASKRHLTTRESPGIISIITREDIVRSGARDLMEVLSIFAPGYGFGHEVEGLAGVGVRGIWSLEGRVLLMMDGQELNEELFASTQFGNHYPADMIERVEVIRGPGSVIYGGYAALGVVNVITRSVNKNGFIVAARNSQMSKTYSHRNVTAGVGHKTEDFQFDFLTTVGTGNRSERDFVDYVGATTNLADKHLLEPKIFNLGIKYKGLEFRGIADIFRTKHVSLWGTIHTGPEPVLEHFDSYNAQISYTAELSKTLKITPKYQYRETHPWKANIPEEAYQFEKYTMRHRFGVQTDYEPSEALGVIAGVEYSILESKRGGDPVLDAFRLGSNLKNEFVVAYAEGTVVTDLGRFILGGRFEDPRNYKSAFVPRVGWTNAWNELHAKVMISQSYRAPGGILPDRSETELTPEVVTNYEVEGGYRLGDKMWFVGNLFKTDIADPLVYMADPNTGIGMYRSAGRLGTQGAEGEFRFVERKYDFLANVAYYQQRDSDTVLYTVPGHPNDLIGFPTMRVNAVAGYKFTESFGIHPSLQYFGRRFGYVSAGNLKEFEPVIIGNLNFRYSNLFLKGLSATAGVMNVADADLPLVQGYDNALSPLPGLSRAYNLMLSYSQGF